MREILFRAKRTKTDKWICGLVTLINEKGNYCLIRPTGSNESFNCELPTLCQYTGLKDKDGKKIFEGDILNVIYSDPQGECHYTEDYVIDDLRNTSVIGWLDYANELEVVGNIFDEKKE